MKCKITGKKINPFMSFGRMPIANGFLKKNQFVNEFFFDMEVGFSEDLSLLQLNDHPKPDMMFNENYPFFTGSSEQMKLHFRNYADWIKKYHQSTIKNIIEIGSNDGTFLKNFMNNDCSILGFEPSKNVAQVASDKGIEVITEFFDQPLAESLVRTHQKADAILSANVMCHIPYMHSIYDGVKTLLKDDGVFIFEDPYLAYNKYANTGVVKSDNEGNAVLEFRKPQGYKVPYKNKILQPHVHYRECFYDGMLDSVKTLFL